MSPAVAPRLDDDAHVESSFEVTLRPGHSIHATRSLVVPPSLYQPAAAPPSSSSSKTPSDVFASFSGDKIKSSGGGNVIAVRGWGGGQARPQGRSVKWGESGRVCVNASGPIARSCAVVGRR